MADITISAGGTGNIEIGFNNSDKISVTFLPTGDVTPCSISGTFSLASSFTFSGLLRDANTATLEAPIPAVAVKAMEGSAYLSEEIPAIVPKSLTARTDYFASAYSKIPAMRISATGIPDLSGYLSKSIPGLRISATAHSDAIATLSQKIPDVRISASALSGYAASLSQSIPAIDISASSYFSSGATLSRPIPAIRAHGSVIGTITFLSMNTKNFAVSTYSNYDFNNICIFNGTTIGSKSDGIYELSGSKDENDTIIWKVNTGLLDFKGSNLRYVIVNGKLPSDIIAIVALPDGTEYEYRIDAISEYEDELRIKVGKGLDDRYMSVELTNEDSNDVSIDSIALFGLKSSSKR